MARREAEADECARRWAAAAEATRRETQRQANEDRQRRSRELRLAWDRQREEKCSASLQDNCERETLRFLFFPLYCSACTLECGFCGSSAVKTPRLFIWIMLVFAALGILAACNRYFAAESRDSSFIVRHYSQLIEGILKKILCTQAVGMFLFFC